MKKILLSFGLVILCFKLSFSQSFTPGNFLVYVYGNGVDNLPGSASKIVVPTFLIEYDLNGNIVQTKALPTVAEPAIESNPLSGGVVNLSEGLLTLSPNGEFATMIGHIVVPDGIKEYSGSTQRIIGIVTKDGAVNTATRARSATNNPNGAVTNNGRNLWFASSTGLRYKPENVIASTDSLLNSSGYFNSVYIYNNQLYYSSNFSPKIGKIGNGLSYDKNLTPAALPGLNYTGSPAQFLFLDTDSTTPEPDLLYIADDADFSIHKYVYDFSTSGWVAKGSTSVAGNAGISDQRLRALTGNISSGNVTLYSASTSSLIKILDGNASTSTIDNTITPTILATATSGKALFKGVSFTPGTGVVDLSTNTDPNNFASLMQNAGLIYPGTTPTINQTETICTGVQKTTLQYQNSANSIVTAFFVKVDLSVPGIKAEYITPTNRNTPGGTLQTVRGMVTDKNASVTDRKVVAAINGEYYTGGTTTLGLAVKSGTLLKEAEYGFFPNIQFTNAQKALVSDQFGYRVQPSGSITEAIGGRYFFLRKGIITGDSYQEAVAGTLEPRTSVGLLAPDKLLFICIDGRRSGWSVGSSIGNLAKIYKAIGATDAINLDGGGSTTMVTREQDGSYLTVNKPSDNSERAVADGLAITASDVVLPIELTSFKAVPFAGSVKVTWSTANETNNDFFTLRRSRDGKQFDDVVKIKGAGNSSGVLNYEWMDHNPYSGTSYYYLKQTDFNGTYTVSEPVAATIFSRGGSDLTITPNPVTDKVLITLNDQSDKLDFDLIDSRGLTVVKLSGSLSLINEQLNQKLSSLTAGVYIARITGANGAYISKFIKQ